MGYAGRKPKRIVDGLKVSAVPKHTVWPGLYVQIGFRAENGVIRKEVR